MFLTRVALLLVVGVVAINCQKPNPNCIRPPVDIDGDDCCDAPMFFLDDIVDKCDEEFGVKGDSSSEEEDDDISIPEGACVVECVLNATGMTADGIVTKDELKKSMLSLEHDAAWESVVDAGLTYCFDAATKHEELYTKQQTKVPKNPNKKICSEKHGFIIGCAYHEFFKNCPADKWTESEKCNKLKDFAHECSF